MVGLAQLLDDLALIVGVILCDLLGLVGARRLLGHSGTYLGQRHWTYAVHTHGWNHRRRTMGDDDRKLGEGGQAKRDDPEQTPARKKKSY